MSNNFRYGEEYEDEEIHHIKIKKQKHFNKDYEDRHLKKEKTKKKKELFKDKYQKYE